MFSTSTTTKLIQQQHSLFFHISSINYFNDLQPLPFLQQTTQYRYVLLFVTIIYNYTRAVRSLERDRLQDIYILHKTQYSTTHIQTTKILEKHVTKRNKLPTKIQFNHINQNSNTSFQNFIQFLPMSSNFFLFLQNSYIFSLSPVHNPYNENRMNSAGTNPFSPSSFLRIPSPSLSHSPTFLLLSFLCWSMTLLTVESLWVDLPYTSKTSSI